MSQSTVYEEGRWVIERYPGAFPDGPLYGLYHRHPLTRSPNVVKYGTILLSKDVWYCSGCTEEVPVNIGTVYRLLDM